MKNTKQTLTLTELQQLAADQDCYVDFQFEVKAGGPDILSGRFDAHLKPLAYEKCELSDEDIASLDEIFEEFAHKELRTIADEYIHTTYNNSMKDII